MNKQTYRRVIQIATAGVRNTCSTQCDWVLYALCDDGSVWEMPSTQGWTHIDTSAITSVRLPSAALPPDSASEDSK